MLACIHCGRDDHTQSNDSTVVIGTYGDERIFLQEHWGMEATYLIFLPLVEGKYGYDEPQPALAERWTHSEDYREWTFYLRKDVKWHDGVPVTAHDIKFTLELRRKLNLGGGAVEILDDYIFKVTYPRPKNGLDTSAVYYPKHLLERLDPEEFFDWDFWTHPVGNGPYRYVRHIPETMVEVEANPDHYRGMPKIERVILKFGGDTLTELMSGNVDAIGEVSRLDLLAIEKDSRFRSFYGWWNKFSALYWNHEHSLFQSPEIRKALTLAINRLELAELLNYPEDIPIKDTITTSRQFRRSSKGMDGRTPMATESENEMEKSCALWHLFPHRSQAPKRLPFMFRINFEKSEFEWKSSHWISLFSAGIYGPVTLRRYFFSSMVR
jgi:peptide/nickel transport system substrate-binding protein